jgi:hypothetical protein
MNFIYIPEAEMNIPAPAQAKCGGSIGSATMI